MLRDVLAGIETEIFVARQAAGCWLKPPRVRNTVNGTQHQMQVLGVRNQRQEDQQRERVQPTSCAPARLVVERNAGQVRDHQDEDQQCDDAGFGRDFAPSHFGRTMKRRMKSPAMETATATANTASETEIEAAEAASRAREARAEAARRNDSA